MSALKSQRMGPNVASHCPHDDVVPGQGERAQIPAEVLPVDAERWGARSPLATVTFMAPRRSRHSPLALATLAMKLCGPRVEEGEEQRVTELQVHLHSVGGADAGDGMQRYVQLSIRIFRRADVVVICVEVEEETLAESLAAAFLHLRLGQPLHGMSLDEQQWRRRGCRCWWHR